MLNRLKIIKNDLYWKVLKNRNIEKRYLPYKQKHLILHKFCRPISWAYLGFLIIKFKLFKASGNAKYPESKYNSQFDLNEIEKLIDSYDIVSFDVFDTLLFRALKNPTDVHLLTSLKNGKPDFYRQRLIAEDLSRNFGNHYECTFKEIYDKYNKITTSKITGDDEISVEKAVLFANEYMKKVYEMCSQKNKPMIIVSDMYLSKDDVGELLRLNGFKGFKKIYISSEYRMCKGTSMLFTKVVKDNKGKKILHFGDNVNADCLSTRKFKNIKSVHYKNATDMGSIYRDHSNSPAFSIYSGLVNAKLHSGVTLANKHYEFGYTYGGLLTYGYCQFIDEQIKKENSKILFVARDSKVFFDVYKKHFNNVPTEYIYASRESLLKACFPFEKELFFEALFISKTSLDQKQKISELFESLGWSSLLPKLKKYKLEDDDFVEFKTLEPLRKFIFDLEKEISVLFTDVRNGCISYLKKACGDAKNIYIVDLGWRGTIFHLLSAVIEREIKGTTCVGFEVGSTRLSLMPVSLIESGRMIPYCFSHNLNSDIQIEDKHVMLAETLFTSEEPGCVGYKLNNGVGEPIYGESENLNSRVFEDLKDGMRDFSNDFDNVVRKLGFPIRVSGRDAFTPLNSIFRCHKYMLYVFGDLNSKDMCAGKAYTLKQVLRRMGYR